LWAACDLEDTVGKGKEATTWKGHWVVGWDFGAREYRGQMVDSWGAASTFKGSFTGEKITFESLNEIDMMGKMGRVRISFDATDPKVIKFTSEHQFRGEPWVVDELNDMKSAAK
jgi:hypothetical protein